MPEIKLYKSPIKSLRLVLLTLPFVICGVFILVKTDGSNSISIFCISFFGLGLLLGLFNMLDKRPQIIINRIGVWDRSMNQKLINWEYIQKVVSPIEIYSQRFIPLVVNEQFVRKKKVYKWVLQLRDRYAFKDINLNISYINIDVEKLIALLNILKDEKLENRDVVIEMYKYRVAK